MNVGIHKCTRCSFTSSKFSRVVSPIGSVHRNAGKTAFVWGVNGCCKTYSLFHSFRRQLYRCHRSVLELDGSNEDFISDALPTSNSLNVDSQPPVGESDPGPSPECGIEADSHDQLQHEGEQSLHEFVIHFKKQLGLLFFRLAEVHKLPTSTTEVIFDDFKLTIRDVLSSFAAQIMQSCEVTSQAANQMTSLLDGHCLDELFEYTSTQHQKEKFARENLPYVHPQERTLGHSETFQYVPVKSVLQNLLLSESCRGHLNDYAMQRKPSHLLNLRDGLLFTRKAADLIQEGSQFTLFIVMYSDELEIDNPLGAKHGMYKLFIVYFSVVNIHARYRSQLSSIHVAIIAKYTSVQKHGLSAIMTPLLEDINSLRDVGFTIEHLNTNVKVTAVLIAFCGDNLSMNKVGDSAVASAKGAHVAFAQHQLAICRPFLMRMTLTYGQKLHMSITSEILWKTHHSQVGHTVSKSPLLDLKYFDITLQLPPDLMHDILEGIIPHVLREVLHGLIREKTMSYSDLDRVAAFDYGPQDKNNRPEPLTRGYVQGQTTHKGRASQKWCLFYLFALIYEYIVPEDNEHWEVYLKMRGVVDLVFADELPRDHVAFLQDEIQCFLRAFVITYPEKMIPKLHFLIHYPRMINELGPLKQYWCMRYESKHQYIKRIASRNKNCRNIYKSVITRHQLLQSFEMTCLDLDTALGTTEARAVDEGHLPDCTKDRFSSGIPVWEVATACVEHCEFRIQDVVLLCKGDFPCFGQIFKLFVYSGSLFIVVNELKTTDFNRHHWSYTVKKTGKQRLVSPTDIAHHDVHDLYFEPVLVSKPGIMTNDYE